MRPQRPLRVRAALAVLAFVLGATPALLRAGAPQSAAVQATLQDLLPLDPAVRTGTLSNGLTYYVRQNGRPANRMSLRLVVKAGSIEEEEDQQGLAHLIEHMAFNGSTHFKPGELVSYFESAGAQLGPHLNAYTSFDETVYMLDLPSDKPEIIAKGLTALADFAGGLALDPAEIDKERGVVIEEWRQGLGASSRVRDKQAPVVFYKSRYAERLAIGKPDVVRTAPAARLRSFYDTWYRPGRMAVVAVGDLDAGGVQTALSRAFGSLMDRAAAHPAPDRTIPLQHPLLVSVVSDPELTESSVQVLRKRQRDSELHVSDYRRDLIERMVEHMLNDRLGDLARKPDAKFLGGGASGGGLGPTANAFALEASVPDGRIEDGAAVLAAEAKRIREFGFSASEIERAKRWLTAYYERAYLERDKNDSGAFAQEYISYFLENEPSPGIQYEYELVQKLLPGIATTDVGTVATRLLNDDGRVLMAVSPQKAGVHVPSEHDLEAALTAAERVAVTPWDDTAANAELMDRKPRPGTVASRRELKDLGITIVNFSNGVEAWLKPTDFKNDQVLFALDAKGGASLAPPDQFAEASLSSDFVRLSGVGGLSPTDLQKLLAGKAVSVAPSVGLSTHSLNGSAAPADLETALQLLYQTFAAPGNDAGAFTVMKRQLDAAVANHGAAPSDQFAERLGCVNTSNHYICRPLTPDQIMALDRDRMAAFYRDRFSNAADFTFFMVGSFRTDEVVPLLAQYVGGLPSTGTAASTFKDVGLHFPESIERVTVKAGREPRAAAVVSFFADPPPSSIEQERLAEASAVLETRLRDVLREDLGQTYTVSVDLSQSLPQRGDGHVEISFGAAPENLPAMTDRVLKEVRMLQDEGPSADLTNKAQEGARREYESALKQNTYWLRRMESVHLLGNDPADIARRTDRIDAVTPRVLQDVFRKYFPADRYTVVTLVPADTGH
jgi:zinc protease